MRKFTLTPFLRIVVCCCCARCWLCGCAGLRPRDLDHAETLAAVARPTALDCDRADACAEASPLLALGDRALSESTADKPVNYVEIVESGQDSLQGRINLIRSARSTIDLQTFIFSHDDTGFLFFNELVRAARRGVRVRLLVDQLFGPSDPDLAGRSGGRARELPDAPVQPDLQSRAHLARCSTSRRNRLSVSAASTSACTSSR